MFESLSTKNNLRNILKLLDKEQKYILGGDFSGIGAHSEKLEKLADTLTKNSGNLDQSALNEITRTATRNQQLLFASLSGLNRARNVMSEHRNTVSTVSTYTSDGDRLEITDSDGGKNVVV